MQNFHVYLKAEGPLYLLRFSGDRAKICKLLAYWGDEHAWLDGSLLIQG